MRIAIIIARGGSKRIPRKNIKSFHGKPIIAYSIETAINSNLFDRVTVSTDDDEISLIAKKYHAEVPIKNKVDQDSAKASYTNGILELKFNLVEHEKPKGKTVEVE